MEQNANIFNPFVEQEEIIHITPAKYYQKMKKSGVYGGQQEIYSFSQIFNVPVKVLDQKGITYNHNTPDELTIENEILAVVVYDSVGKHYDTARPLNDDDNDEGANDKNSKEDQTTDFGDQGGSDAGLHNDTSVPSLLKEPIILSQLSPVNNDDDGETVEEQNN